MNVRCIIRDKNNEKILLCRPINENFYFLPGGGVEFQEISTDAVFRELKEEAGLEKDEVKIIDFRGSVENIFSKYHGVDLVYNVAINRENVVAKEGHIEYTWLRISELEKIDLRPKVMIDLIQTSEKSHFISCDK